MVVEQAQRVFLVGVAIQVLLTTEHSYVIVGPALEAPGKDCGERKREGKGVGEEWRSDACG